MPIDVTKANEFQRNGHKSIKPQPNECACAHKTAFKVLQFNGSFNIQFELQTWRFQPKIGDIHLQKIVYHLAFNIYHSYMLISIVI